MKKLIVIILVLIGFSSYGQNYLVQPAKWEFTNSQRFDSTVRFYNLPLFTGDTIIGYNPLTGKLGRKILTSSGGTWGSITGTLSNQTDLQNALNAKQATLSLTTTGTSGAATLVGATLNIPQYSGTTYSAGNGLILGGTTFYRDSLKTTGQYGNSWQNGMYLGSSNNRSVRFHSNSLLRCQLDSNGRWGFGTMKPIAPIHIGVAGSGRQKFMFVAEPNFLSTYGFNFYTDANTGDFSIWGFNNSVESTVAAISIHRNTGVVQFGGSSSAVGYGRLTIPKAPTASSNYANINLANTETAFNGSSTGKAVLAATGTYQAFNSVGSVAYNFIDAQKNGTSKFKVDSTGSVQSTGGLTMGYVAKTANYTLTASDYTVDCTSGTFTATLPTAVGCAGRIYNIANSGAGTITIGTTSSQTFVNVTATPTTLTMATLGNYQVQSNGANWIVLSNY